MNNLQETIHIQVDNLQEEGLRKMQQTQPSLLAENNGLQLSTANAQKDLPAFILQYHEAGLQINGVRIQQVNLETLFLNLTGRQLRD